MTAILATLPVLAVIDDHLPRGKVVNELLNTF